MQYNININQFAAVKAGFKFKLDHLAIIDCLSNKIGNPRFNSILEERHEYTWVSHKVIMQDLPICDFEVRTLQRRIADLEKWAIVVRAKGQFASGGTYYRRGENWGLLFYTPDKIDATPDRIDRGTPDKNDTPPRQNCQTTIVTNTITTTNTIGSPPKKNSYSPDFLHLWEVYDFKQDKHTAYKGYKALTKAEKQALLESVPAYKAYWKSKGANPDYHKKLHNYIKGRCWENNWQALTKPTKKPNLYSPPMDNGGFNII